MKTNSEYISVKHVADYLGVTRQTVNNWIKNGTFKAYRLPSGTIKIRKDDFLEYLKKNNLFVDQTFFSNSPLKIMVIDDEEGIVDYLENTITKFFRNCKFYSATDGISGLLKIGEFNPDLIFLDIEMPEMNGLEVCRKIQDNPSLQNSKIVITTGYLEKYDKKIKELNVWAVLKKPFGFNELENVITPVIESR